ncbi:ELM1/GtrOC1 family putative glycosyltransferase [Candidatus Omnitrophota bacterium]
MLYSVLDYICAILVRGANIIFHILPTSVALWLGRRIGTAVYFLNTERRVIGYANLRAAYSATKTPAELRKIIKNVYKSWAEIFCEILTLTKINEKYIDKYIEIVNPNNMLDIKDYPKGVILLTAHFGNWELAGMIGSLKGFPLLVLAREQKMKRLNALINTLRESKGLTVVAKGFTTKNIVKALRDGKKIGMVGDQDAGKTGMLVDFFGRPSSTAPGSARIAAKTGAYILPAFMARLTGCRHRLVLEKPMLIKEGEDIRPYLEKYNQLLEKNVREHPEQWLWLHKRWKSTPLKKVVILSDGKAGHLNQSLAVSKELKRYREDSGYVPTDTEVTVVDIKFKNKFTKALLDLTSVFSNSACQGCMRCLKMCITKESYDNLMSKYADIVLSTGSGVAAVNRFFTIENNAKSAVIMKPSIVGVGKFDMAILPRHDGAETKDEGKIIAIDTAPNLVDEKYLEEAREKISGIVRAEKPVKIGVLLGGNNKDFALTEGITEELLDNVINASNKLDADLLFTTSRRTPKSSEKLVKDKLRSEKRCKLLVVANEKNVPHVVGGILGLSDVVVVSGESTSMVSEAVFSGKTVIVVKLKKKKKTPKLEKMLNNLKSKGYIIVTEAEELSDAISRGVHTPRSKNLPEDRFDVYKYMWRLGL